MFVLLKIAGCIEDAVNVDVDFRVVGDAEELVQRAVGQCAAVVQGDGRSFGTKPRQAITQMLKKLNSSCAYYK